MASLLRKKLGALPRKPGTYLFKDRRKRVIYVGKARNLRERVSHYYQNLSLLPPKTASLVSQTRDIDYIATDSEVDATLLEAKLIRDIKPRYNIQLKDDKTFPLLAISRPDDFPRVFITRQRGRKDLVYYGPFVSATDLRSVLKVLQRIFKFRTCSKKLHYGKKVKECLLYHINRCIGPCRGNITKDRYRRTIYLLEQFLKGNKDLVINQLTKQMRTLSRQKDFEEAAIYRDRIKLIQGLLPESRMGEFYEGALAALNPAERLSQLQELFNLEHPPRKIEGIDISDIKGKEAVGSLVTFIDGEPFKNGYRRYRIKSVTEGEPDDYARMAEIIRRRLTDRDNPLPDILLIDGGAGHLSVVEKTFAEYKIKPPLLAGLSKSGGDHLFSNLKSQIPNLKFPHHPGFRLLQYIRDEAHRFAQKYHHLLRKKTLVTG